MSYPAAGRPDWSAADVALAAKGISNIIELINGQGARNNETLRQILAGAGSNGYRSVNDIQNQTNSLGNALGFTTPATMQFGGVTTDLNGNLAGNSANTLAGKTFSDSDTPFYNANSSLIGDGKGDWNSAMKDVSKFAQLFSSGNGQNGEAQQNQGLMQQTANANNQVVQQQQSLLNNDETSNKKISQPNTVNPIIASQATISNTANPTSSNITPSGIPSLREYAQLAIKNGVRDPNMIVKSYNSVIAPLEADHKRVELQKAMRTYLTSNDPTEKANAIANIHYYQGKPFGDLNNRLKEAQINESQAKINESQAKVEAYRSGLIGADGRVRRYGGTGGYTGGYSRAGEVESKGNVYNPNGGYYIPKKANKNINHVKNEALKGEFIKRAEAKLRGEKVEENDEETKEMSNAMMEECGYIAGEVLRRGGSLNDAILYQFYFLQNGNNHLAVQSGDIAKIINQAMIENGIANVGVEKVLQVMPDLTSNYQAQVNSLPSGSTNTPANLTPKYNSETGAKNRQKQEDKKKAQEGANSAAGGRHVRGIN